MNSLSSHRDDNKLKDELRWLKTTVAAHETFKKYLDTLGSYDYQIRQIVFIVYKDDTPIDSSLTAQQDIHNHLEAYIKNLLTKEFEKESTKDKVTNHLHKNELHFIVFALPSSDDAFQKFEDIFNIRLTPPRERTS